jgi:hypothetical protein
MTTDVTFDDLLADNFYSKIIDVFIQNFGSPLSDDVKNFLVDFAGNGELRRGQKKDWIAALHRLTETICLGSAHPAEYPLFWIKLHGAIEEMAEKQIAVPTSSPLARFFQEEHSALASLKDTLSLEERMVVCFIRHNQCHPQPGYVHHRMSISKKGTPVVQTPDEPKALEVVRGMLSQTDWSQEALAKQFALKIRANVATLAILMSRD